MTPSPVPSTASEDIIAAEPQLLVSDLGPSLNFYTTKLRFQIVFVYGDPTFYAQVARGGARLNLRRVSGPTYDERFRKREPDVLAATLTVKNIKPIFLELRTAGVDFHQPLRTEPWGARTFIVRDPDGNLLCFAGHDGGAVGGK